MNVKISEVAKLMGKSEQFVRIGLQRGLLPIGTAIKTGTKYSYYISPKLLEEYIGRINKEDEKNEIKNVG